MQPGEPGWPTRTTRAMPSAAIRGRPTDRTTAADRREAWRMVHRPVVAAIAAATTAWSSATTVIPACTVAIRTTVRTARCNPLPRKTRPVRPDRLEDLEIAQDGGEEERVDGQEPHGSRRWCPLAPKQGDVAGEEHQAGEPGNAYRVDEAEGVLRCSRFGLPVRADGSSKGILLRSPPPKLRGRA